MRRLVPLAALVLSATLVARQPADWIAVSNAYTGKLLAIDMKHTPEFGSAQGLAEFDALVSQPTREDDDRQRAEYDALAREFEAAAGRQTSAQVAQDLRILADHVELQLRQQDYARAHKVPFLNASALVFAGLRPLLDEQTPAARRAAAVTRIRKYAGLEPGHEPYAKILQRRVAEQMAVPGAAYPARAQIETELGRNASYVEGIAALLQKYQLKDWQQPLQTLEQQLADYDRWIRENVLPKARTDFRLPPEEYALNLEAYGIDVPADRLAAMAHQAFAELQSQMAPLAAQIAKQRGLASSDYRDVIRELKKEQLVGDAILPLYQQRLRQVEAIISDRKLVTLPERPARIRIASAAETAQQPAPHMVPPPFLHNTGQKGEFVLPLNMPPAAGATETERYDDFTFDAAAWTLVAHEARPGHELQFASMLERGVSMARVQYAFNSTNVEGWGLYAEYLTRPFMPPEGQLISLDYRLLRAARMFLDPELQSGKIQPEDAYRVLEQDVVSSHAFARQEVERYLYRSPGQATTYYYGFSRLLALRQETEAALGPRFDQKAFHDFVLAQGLLPPALLREAVIAEFIPARQR
ncbi:MAG: DUF885 domain-containing protein [Acidobacteria bacterium]|nr:DUF885 domain-containing protein [Acidobacteriota bacterium]